MLVAAGLLFLVFAIFRCYRLNHFKIPLIKSLSDKIILARFARNFAIGFGAGIPILEALKLTARASGSSDFVRLMTEIGYKIRAGISLYHAMEPFSYFPDIMIQMIKTGEESGKLEEMLHKLADMFEAEIEQRIRRFSQLLEPLIMVILGVLIGGLVIGMYLPIFKLGSVL